MTVLKLTRVTPDLEHFIHRCDQMGYKNNNSLKAMKFEWCLENGGEWYASYDKNSIVGISGIHPFKDGWRALFRGAQLYSIPGGLSKMHMNCWMFRDHLPIAIKYFGNKPLYITTNVDNDASGKMLKLNKLYQNHLAKHNIVEHLGQEEVFYTEQNVWKLNIEQYTSIRERLISYQQR